MKPPTGFGKGSEIPPKPINPPIWKLGHSGQLPVTSLSEADPSPGFVVSLNAVCTPPPSVESSFEVVQFDGSVPFQLSKLRLVISVCAFALRANKIPNKKLIL